MQETPKTLSTIGGRKSKNLKDITMDNPQEINRYISLALSKVKLLLYALIVSLETIRET